MDEISEFCGWLSNTPGSVLIQNTAWIIPTVQSVHIFSVGIVLISVAMFNLQMGGLIRRDAFEGGASSRFLPWVWGGMVILFISGGVLIWGEPARELTDFVFWAKMGLLAVAVVSTAILQRIVGDAALAVLMPNRRRLVRVLACLSLLLFVCVLVCGRLIAYTTRTDI